MSENLPHISIVIPVYGARDSLLPLWNRLTSALSQIAPNYEILLVNDACPNGSWDIVKELCQKDARVVGINLSRNFGQHYAITCGLNYSKGEWVVVMDCDLQDQPEEITKLYKKALEGHDAVLARRVNRQDSMIKRQASRLFYGLLAYLTDSKQDSSIANFGIYHRKVIDSILSMKENLRYFPVLVRWVGFDVQTVQVEHAKREIGSSSYTLSKLINLAVDTILAFSDKPLRFVIKLGLIISFSSFICAAYIVLQKLFGAPIAMGWPSVIVSVWFLSGLIIMTLGVVGLYIGRIFDEVKKRPLYIVRDTINDKEA